MLPGSGRQVAASLNAGFRRSRAARGWDLGLGLPGLPTGGPGWTVQWEAVSVDDTRRVRARRPDTDET